MSTRGPLEGLLEQWLPYTWDVPLTRRAFLQAAAVSMLRTQSPAGERPEASSVFRHGVASGEPQDGSVVIWTRVTPAGRERSAVRVRWSVMSDAPGSPLVRSGTFTTSANRDYTVKVDVTGLEAGRAYLYRFDALGETSPVGSTRTVPTTTSQARFAIVSCSNYPAGFFNAYAAIAARDDIDAVIHLGDYVYEFANGTFGDGTEIGRLPQPAHETLTLDDYRQRYATYRTDVDLQMLHQRHPMIAIWDDHEFADNAWTGGVAGWAERRAAAMRAYLEWMPVRETSRIADFLLYRSFRFGNLATLVMLDGRSLRDGQVFANDHTALADPRRRLLGRRQEEWLGRTLRASRASGVTWSLVGQQVMFSPFVPSGTAVRNPDAWDGYQAERARVRDLLGSIGNAAILTGDVHSSWALDVPRDPWSGYRPDTGEGSVAVELITPAVSSPPYFQGNEKETLGPVIRRSLPHLKFLEGENRGYMVLDVTLARLLAEWQHTPDVRKRDPRTVLAARFIVEAGAPRLVAG